MIDDCIQWIVPGLTLGFSVKNDPCGKFTFWNDDVVIRYIDGAWYATDEVDPSRSYATLRDALENEC